MTGSRQNQRSPKKRSGGNRRTAAKRRPNRSSGKTQRRASAKSAQRRQSNSLFQRLRARVGALRSWVWQRRSRLVQAGQLLGVGAAVALIFVAGHHAKQYAKSSSAFELQHVDVEGNKRITPIEVQRISALVQGNNIFEVSPEGARKDLEKHPWIKRATVRRTLPDTVNIVLEEHTPVALVMRDSLFLVDADGDAFKSVGVDDPVDLPVITGLAPGDSTTSPASLRRAVAVLEEYRRAGLWRREPISEIHFVRDGGMSLYVGRDGVHVRLGEGPYRRKLRRLRRVLDHMRSDGARPQYVYLDNKRRPERVTARLQ